MKKYAILSLALAVACLSGATNNDETLFKLRGKGFVAAIDCRKDGKSSDYAEGLDKISRIFGIIVTNRIGQPFSLANAVRQLETSGGSVAVFIIDDESYPMTLAAPEERWAMLNAAKLKVDSPGETILARRLSLLFTRQCCRALGGDEAKGTDTAFHTVLGVKDLDAITSFDITMGPEMSVNDVMGLRGIEPTEFGSYEDACNLGVAPQPTNAVQRAIWEKVHAPPSKPIRITYDKDNQKPVVK